MKKENLRNLFVSELKDVLSAEHQIVKALPTVIAAAEDPELKKAFESHLKETKEQVVRLEKIFTMLGIKAEEVFCEAMKGLIDECSEAIKEHTESATRDAAIISKAQRIEHYEISVYGTLSTFAKELGLDAERKLIEETLKEESNADKKLTKIAEGGLLTTGINRKALKGEK